jgi:hypothetical protein
MEKATSKIPKNKTLYKYQPKNLAQNMLAFRPFKDILVQEIGQWCITKVEKDIILLFGLFDSVHNFLLGGQLYVVKIIYLSSDVIVSKQMTNPPLPLPLELPYLQYPSSVAGSLKNYPKFVSALSETCMGSSQL